jgi:hypothetical protein
MKKKKELSMNIDMLVRDLDPAPAAKIPGPDSPEALAIFDHLVDAPRAHRRSGRAVGRVALATAGAVAAATLLLVVLLPGPPGSPARPTGAAAATFGRLARVAGSQPPSSTPAPGQYQYTESQAAYEDCVATTTSSYCYLMPQQRQIWIGTDGSGRILEAFGTPSFLSAVDHDAWLDAGSPTLTSGPSDTTFARGGLTDGPTNLSSLPVDPNVLAAELSGRKIEGGPPGPAEDFVQIGDLLRETDASPVLRAALFEVAEQIPGVKVLGNTSDHAGRTGIGVARVGEDGVEQIYVFDPNTSALLGEETIATRAGAGGPGIAAGTVLGWAAYLRSGVVDSVSDTPTGTIAPPPPAAARRANPIAGASALR